MIGGLWTLAGVVYRAFPPVAPQLVPGSGGGYRVPRDHAWANLGGQPPHVAAAWFWALGVPLAWALCGWLFNRRRQRGLGSPGGVIAGIGMLPFAVLAIAELVVAPHVASVHRMLDDPAGTVKPAVAVAVGLVLVAAWERHLWLGLAGGLFLVVPNWASGQYALLATVPWAPEVLNVELQLLWWGPAMMAGAVTGWAIQRRRVADRT